MSDRWEPGSLAEEISRLIYGVDGFNRDLVRGLADRAQNIERRSERISSERDGLRDEVVRLRGDRPCVFTPLARELGQRNAWKCGNCEQVTEAPVHAYFAPCSGEPLGVPVYQEGELIGHAYYTGFTADTTEEDLKSGRISASFEYRLKLLKPSVETFTFTIGGFGDEAEEK